MDFKNTMNRISKRFSSPAGNTELKSLKDYKRKTLYALLWGTAFITAAMLGILVILRFTAPLLVPDQDQQLLFRACIVILLGILVIALLERYISYEAASLAFNFLLIVGILLGDSPQELAFGRSLIFLILPVVTASVLLRPWAGLVVAALSCTFITAVPIYLHTGLPNFPAILILILVAVIIQQATSNLGRVVAKELKDSHYLLESQDRYLKVTESLSNAIFIVDLAGIITDCNGVALKMLGISSKQDLLGLSGSSLVHPDEKVLITEINAQMLQKGSFRRTDFKSLRKDGSTFITDISAATITGWEGKPSSFVFMLQDITERKQAEIALRESEEKYRRLIETLPIGVIVHQGGPIQLINPTGAKIMGGKTQEELIGTYVLDLVHPDYQQVVRKRIQATLTHDLNAEPIEEKLMRIDGTTFDAEVVALPINFKDKASMLVMFADITERKQAEAALRKSEENFRNLSENTADGILIVAPDGRHIYGNRHACDLLRYSPEEMLQTSQIDLADSAAYPQLQQRLQDRLAGRPGPTMYETVVRRKDGTSFPADITATRTVWQDQTCDLVLFRDITEHKQAQEAIKSQNQRIQEVSRQLVEVQERERHLLASELHDDLGQSLTSLKLMLELASSTRTTNKQQEVMGDARELVSELMGKVRNLSLDLRPAMLDDFGLFAALRWLFERFHGQTGISIQCNYNLTSNQRFPPPVETAAFRIVQESLTNIARHAGVQEAQVNIEIGKTLSIGIADTGTGFDFAHDNVQMTADSGGLSGMQERARLLGGQLQIYSEKGSGTRVVAEIPLTGGA
jgi:PAS domain S-box-containing protein